MAFEKLINGNKLPVLFIGSGFSRRYLDAPDWDNLLIQIYKIMGKQTFDFTALKSKLKNTSENRYISKGELNGLVANVIEEEFNDYFYESDLMNKYADWIKKDLNPFRMCIANILNNLTHINEKEEEIEAFTKLQNKVKSIITTNYDLLIEELFNMKKENTFIGQPQLFNPNSVELGELYKIHGCITDPNNIIITNKDYDNFKTNAKLFSAKLLTLISENPVIFIGYSIDDSNIQQTLSDLVRCLSREQIEELKNHFYLIEFNKGKQELMEKEYLFRAKSYDGEETVFPISIITTDNYLEIYKKLSNLTPAMNIDTVKKVKRIVNDIVIESIESKPKTEETITVFMDDIGKLTETHQKFAIAVGYAKDINETYGYNLRPLEDILEDVLFNNKNLNSKRLIKDTYEKAYFRIKRTLPIYKYIKDLNNQEFENCPQVLSYISIHNKKEHYLNPTIIKSIKNIPSGDNIDKIPQYYVHNSYQKNLWIIKNIENFNLNSLKKYLQKEFYNYKDYNANKKSDYRRLVSLYDLYAYKKQ